MVSPGPGQTWSWSNQVVVSLGPGQARSLSVQVLVRPGLAQARSWSIQVLVRPGHDQILIIVTPFSFHKTKFIVEGTSIQYKIQFPFERETACYNRTTVTKLGALSTKSNSTL